MSKHLLHGVIERSKVAHVAQATQAALEAETNEDTYAPPDLIKHSPGVAKFWVNFDGTAVGPITPRIDYNVVDITDHGTGDYTINIETDFSGVSYSVVAMAGKATGVEDVFCSGPSAAVAAGTFRFELRDNAGTSRDRAHVMAIGSGDQ